MFKLIIADDERIIRETISHLIDWNSIGIELTGLCRDGIEAYNMILDESPDIVLTDIRMPGMSGLELVDRISQTDLDIQFILLSGYGEFDYAREGMRHGIRHYLLKPCNEEQIIASMKDAIEECSRRRAFRAFERQQNRRGDRQNIAQGDVIRKLQSYVEQNLSDPNLTLKWIAENYLYMNVDYVSKKFIKETGNKFSKYITDLRIQKAKELFAQDPAMPVQVIAEKVGCGNNPQYFSQIFKKSTGLTPSAYAKSIARQ